MGACQSRATDPLTGANFDSDTRKTMKLSAAGVVDETSSRPKTTGSIKSSRDGRFLLLFPKKSTNVASLVSPSEKTETTAPETPSYQLTSSGSRFDFVSPMPNDMTATEDSAIQEEHVDENEVPPGELGGYESTSSVSYDNHSGHRSLVMQSVIAEEEESNVAPSDEEGMHSLHLDRSVASSRGQKNSKGGFSDQGRHPLAQSALTVPVTQGSPTRSVALASQRIQRAQHATQLHMLNRRMTTPESIVFRPVPLIAPPKEPTRDEDTTTGWKGPPTAIGRIKPKASVSPQTIANFNRLKVQVQLVENHELHQRRKAKVEDRFQDVKGYRALWKNFKRIKEQVTEKSEDELDNRSNDNQSLALKEPTSWYFDFESLKAQNRFEDYEDDDDDRSQSGLSLLSQASMDAQRDFFQEKKRQRRMNKNNRGRGRNVRGSRSVSDDRSAASGISTNSCRSAVFLRGKTDGSTGDYGPIRQAANMSVEEFSYVGSDDSTPKTKTGQTADDWSQNHDESASVISDLDVDNDYGVSRRRHRRPPHREARDDSSLDTFEEKSLEDPGLNTIEVDIADFKPRIRDPAGEPESEEESSTIDRNKVHENMMRYTLSSGFEEPSASSHRPPRVNASSIPPRSPTSRIEHYGFDPSAPLAFQLELFAQSVPSVQIDDAKTGVVRWREFAETSEKEQKTARRLDGLFEDEPDLTPKEAPSETPQVSKISSPQVDLLLRPKENQSDVADSQSDSSKSDGVKVACCVETIAPSPVKTPKSDSNDLLRHNPYEAMSPDQFFMMSSFPAASGHSDDEEELDNMSNADTSSQQATFNQDIEVTEPTAEIQGNVETDADIPEETSKSKPNPLKTYDPIISSMSTEAFLRMSAWHSGVAPLSETTPVSFMMESDGTYENVDDDMQEKGYKEEDKERCPKDLDSSTNNADRNEFGRKVISDDAAVCEEVSNADELSSDDDVGTKLSVAVDNLLLKFLGSN